MTDSDLTVAAANRARPRLLAIPGVLMVGVGGKMTRGEHQGRLAIKVYVRDKRPTDQVSPGELIPPDIDGIPTDVEVGDDQIVPTQSPSPPPSGAVVSPILAEAVDMTDDRMYRPLLGGARITRHGTEFRGTMGCIVTDRTNPDRAYALTNGHVLVARGQNVVAPVVGATQVGQPSAVVGRVFGNHFTDFIGTYAGGGWIETEVVGGTASVGPDEALITLYPGQQWQADIIDLGVVAGAHALQLADLQPGPYQVRKRGGMTGVTGGVVQSVIPALGRDIGLILIRANQDTANPLIRRVFSWHGDSGSVVINDANEVIGLLFGQGTDSGLSYAFPIQDVLDRLLINNQLDVIVASASAPGIVHTVPGTLPAPIASQPTISQGAR